jgi:hypothetical protein
MPKIPTFESQGRPTAEVPSVKTSFQVPVSNDLFTKAQSTIANYYVREKEAEAKLKSLDYENKAYVGLFDLHDKWKKHPIPSEAADGFQTQAKEYISKYINDNLANENNFVKKATQSKLNGTLSTLNLSVLSKSRDQFEKDQQRVDNEFGTIMGIRLSIDNAYRNFVDQDIDNHINTRFTDPDPVANVNRKRIELQKLLTIKDDTLAYNDARTKPEKFITDITADPTLYKNADQNKIKQYIVLAQNHVSGNAEKLLNNEEKSLLKTGQSTGVDYNLIRQGFVGRPEYEQVNDKLSVLETVKPVISQVKNSKFAEGYKSIELLNLNTNDPVLKAKALTYLKSINDQKINTISKDGGAEYFINNDININNAFDSFLVQQDSESFKTYATLLNKIYDDQQLPNNYRTYLNKNQITELKKTYDGLPTDKQKSDFIENMKPIYGSSYPKIFNQLTKEFGLGFTLSASVNDPELKLALTKTKMKKEDFNRLKEEAILKATGVAGDKTFMTTLEQDIFSKLKNYRSILENQPYSDYDNVNETMSSLREQLTNSAIILSADPKYKTASDLSTAVTSKFLKDYDFSNKNFFIPNDINGEKVSVPLIDAKANIIKREIKSGRLDLNQFDIIPFQENGIPYQDKTIEFIKKNGEFYLDGVNGLVFGVKLPNGKFQKVETVDPVTKTNIPLTINFLDGDGKLPWKLKSTNKNYEINMENIWSYIRNQSISAEMP